MCIFPETSDFFLSMGVVFGKISEELPRHSVVFKASSYTVRRYEPSVAVQCDYTQGWDGLPMADLLELWRRTLASSASQRMSQNIMATVQSRSR